jgi:D-arabinose 1-dehydrogenase-like Zn-dependent alcohol dehydrogenase
MPGQPIFKVPEDLPDEIVAPINCALCQLIYGLSKVELRLGDTIVIQGAGGLGVYAIALAKEMGADKVIVLDRFENRLQLASRFGADHVININMVSTKERIGQVREITQGRGADIVIEVAGSPQAVNEGLPLLRVGGSYLWIGNICRGMTVELDPSAIVLGNRKIIGVATYDPGVMPQALNFLKRTRGKYPFDQILSHKFKLEEINTAFELASQGKVNRATIIP